jgi:N-glycosyltransferase
VAAELLEIPHAVMSIGLGMPRQIIQPMAGDLADLPTRYGLSADPQLERTERYLYLVAAPPSFDPPWLPRGSTVQRIRTLVLEADAEGAPPSAQPHQDRPLIHATLGTVFNQTPAVLQAIVDAVTDEDVELILSVGRNGSPDELTSAANVRIEKFVSHPQLLPKCDVVIAHGGFGTAMAAASVGVPACLLPLSADQPLTAAGYASTGAAINLANHVPPGSPGPIVDPDAIEPQAIRQAVRRLLDEPAFGAAAQRLREEVEALPSLEVAVQLLERLAETREPVLGG